MSDIVIRVEGLGKCYTIRHRGRRDHYATLRESVAGYLKSFRKFSPRNRYEGDTQEEFWALKDVSFQVKSGEVIGVIGRNGAGKSTLLKVMSRITEPTKGRVTVEGRVASLLEVGTGFHPELTGRENVFLNGSILGMSRVEVRSKFDEIVAFAEVERFLDTPIKRYSSGMYMRLAFAVAAHLESEVLIVDEVLAVGDASFQKKCLGKMGELAGGGRTILLVSHNMSVIGSLCRSGIYLDNGQVVATGPIAEVLKKYSQKSSSNLALPFQGHKPAITSIDIDPAFDGQDVLRINVGFKSPFVFKPVIGLVVATEYGSPVFGTNQVVNPPNSGVVAQGASGSCSMTLPSPPLHSGLYMVSIWLSDGLDTVYDHLHHAVSFEYVSPQTLPARYSTSTIGPVRVDARWQLVVER